MLFAVHRSSHLRYAHAIRVVLDFEATLPATDGECMTCLVLNCRGARIVNLMERAVYDDAMWRMLPLAGADISQYFAHTSPLLSGDPLVVVAMHWWEGGEEADQFTEDANRAGAYERNHFAGSRGDVKTQSAHASQPAPSLRHQLHILPSPEIQHRPLLRALPLSSTTQRPRG